MITGVLLLGAMVSGGLLSSDKPMPALILRVHQIISFTAESLSTRFNSLLVINTDGMNISRTILFSPLEIKEIEFGLLFFLVILLSKC